jgi:cell division protein FtsW
MRIAINARDSFGALLAVGITSLIGIQALVHIAVVTSSMPPTGIALPFISAGGTSLLIFMSAIGVLLNISKNSL